MKSMEEEYLMAGYMETARIAVESALCMALEEDAVSKNIGEEKLAKRVFPPKDVVETIGRYRVPLRGGGCFD